jgi:acyl-CoA synthetase (AMP-forming)/AMP-acid ligase II
MSSAYDVQVIFGSLPKTSAGKIQRFVLREKSRSARAIDT